MNKKVAITGMGIVSAIGMSVEENATLLKKSHPGLTRTELIDTHLKNQIYVGEIKKSNEELIQLLNLPEQNLFSRTTLLGALAVKEALSSAEIKASDYPKIGFINSTTVGSMDVIERHYLDLLKNKNESRYVEVYDSGSCTQLINEYFGFRSFSTTISTACSSAANAIILGAQLIKNERLDKVIVGGMDALCKFTINGFNTLMILSDEPNRPFDENRKGLNLGEAAAYLVLESETSVIQRGIKPIAFLDGYANTNDAFHQTASSEDGTGAYLAMQNAFKISSISPKDIDYINVHGTATPNNDLSEGRAILRTFNRIPPFSSTKPFTGHTLAAAASVEAVFSIIALNEGLIYPNLNFTEKMKEFDLIPNTTLVQKEINAILSNSFGFGGNSSSLIFTK